MYGSMTPGEMMKAGYSSSISYEGQNGKHWSSLMMLKI